MPPVSPMLAKSVRSIPPDASYEPKWDGFRSICFRDGDEVELGSRNERPMTRYFPELVAAVTAELPTRCVIDGEIVIATDHGLDFEALQQRIHPADSRVRMLAETTPASFIAFDLLALGDDDYTRRPFSERRAALVDALAGSGSLDPRHAGHHRPGDRAALVRRVRGSRPRRRRRQAAERSPISRTSASCSRSSTSGPPTAWSPAIECTSPAATAIGSLLLGLYQDDGQLASVGVIGAFPMAERRRLFTELQPLVTGFDEHPWNWAAHEAGERTPRKNEFSRWNAGKDLSFVPLRPERVVEVRYDHMEGQRFRHTAQFNRWRPDRDPRSCTYEQLETAAHLQPGRHRARPGIRRLNGPAIRTARRHHWLGSRSPQVVSLAEESPTWFSFSISHGQSVAADCPTALAASLALNPV